MGRIYTYYIKTIFRTKRMIFWGLAFPLILGTLFYFAFSSIYGQQASKAMKIAVVGENPADHAFIQALEGLTYENGSKMVDLTFTDEAEAMKMLEADSGSSSLAKSPFGSTLEGKKDENREEKSVTKVIGVIRLEGEEVTLMIAENDMYQSILSGIVSAYRAKADFVADSMTRGEEALSLAIQAIGEDIEYVVDQGMAGENKDPYVAYFYNLIAMMCMLGSSTVLEMIVRLQPNASSTGLRIGASGVSKMKYEAGVFLATLTFQMGCMAVALIYVLGILGINFGGEVPMIILTSFLGVLLGNALGYFVAHIGRFTYKAKDTILSVITLGGGALSGLYAVQLKAVVEEKAPIINRINPMSVITDAFYSLNLFGVGERYYRAMFTMIGLSAGLFLLGALLSRRNSYESL